MLNIDTAPGAATYLDLHAALYYEKGMETAEEEASCNKGHSPPPAPNTDRVYTSGTATDTHTAVLHACANMHQFGLFDQMRLFGLPDVEGRLSSTRGRRTDSSGRRAPVQAPEDLMGASEYQNPASRLEAYLAYRVAATTIWGMLTSSCLGYFGMRSFLPLAVQILSQCGVAKNRRGETIVLTRPKLELPLFLGSISSILMFAYIFYLDPASSPTATSRTSASTGPGRTRGRPRARSSRRVQRAVGRRSVLGAVRRLDHAVLGYLPLLLQRHLLPLRVQAAKEDRGEQNRWSRRTLGGFFALFAFVVLSVGLFAGIAEKSGQEYHVVATAGGDTTREARRLGNDCIAAVYASFWLSALIGHCRARWALDAMSKFFKGIWLALGFLLAAIPIIQTPVLVGRDLWEGKTSNGLDVSTDRTTMVTFLYIAMAGQMGVFAFIGFGFISRRWTRRRTAMSRRARPGRRRRCIDETEGPESLVEGVVDAVTQSAPLRGPRS